jgi:hypothetical protein
MRHEEKLRAIETLSKSKGWIVLKEVMEAELVQAAMAIAHTPSMPVDEINFRRGSIWAAERMIDLPSRLRMKLESEAALSDLDKQKKSLNAVEPLTDII